MAENETATVRKTDYPTGPADGMEFINNRWVFTGPKGYRVVFDGTAAESGDSGADYRVFSYNAARTRPVSGLMTEDAAHALAASLAAPRG